MSMHLAVVGLWAASLFTGPPADDAANWAAAATAKRASIQARAAESTGPLQRVRLDQFTAEGGAVKVSGVFLTNRAGDEKRLAEDRDLDDALMALLRKELVAPTLRLDLSALTRVPLASLPQVRLQAAANQARVDDLVIDEARFNAAGQLAVIGRAGSAPALSWLAKAAPAVLAAQTEEKADLTGVVRVEWKATPAALQRRLAAATSPTLRQTRCDRVFVEYLAGATGLRRQLVVDGVKLGEAAPDGRELSALVNGLLPSRDLDGTAGPSVEQNLSPILRPEARIAEPLTKLREHIAQTPALDGVRLDPGLSFNAEGRLVLAGLIPTEGANRSAAVEAEVSAALAKPGDLVARGVSARELRSVPVGKLAADLRKWASDTRDDVRIDRVFFGPAGELTVLGVSPTAEEALVAEEAKRLAAASEFPAPPGADPAVRVQLARLPDSLTKALRSCLTAEHRRWAGVQIERGFFDAAGRYTLRGAVDTPEQNDALREVVEEFARDTRWADFFRPAAAPVRLEVLPLATLLDRFRRVARAYPEFDGLTFTGCRHDREKGLVFEVSICGETNLNSTSSRAERILRADSRWGRRAAQGVRVVSAGDRVPSNPTAAVQSAGQALDALGAGRLDTAREHIDYALRHDPETSAYWFLSAYHAQLSGDHEAIRRDLCRMIQLETGSNGEDARKTRGEMTSRLQGADRMALSKAEAHYRKALADGLGPLTLGREPKREFTADR